MKPIFFRRDALNLILCVTAIGLSSVSVQYLTAQALPTPAVTGPLSTASPTAFDAGPLGKLDVTGIISGMAVWQDDPALGDEPTHIDISNGQVFLQKTTGVLQFYLQAGAYNIPALGTPYLSTSRTLTALYGPLPVGYLKIQATKNFSIEIGQLPTLIGAEYAFTFENMNIERGLLWNQENVINRGVQLNDSMGHVTASLSWNDGFYSNRYTWVSGMVSYTAGPNALTVMAGGNAGHTGFRTLATPVQNNGSIYDVMYTYTKGPWIIQPYFQYTSVPTDIAAGVARGADTRDGAVLVDYNFKHGISLGGAGRVSFEHGRCERRCGEPAVWAGERGLVADADADVSEERFFCARGSFVGASGQFHAGRRIWAAGDESGSSACDG